MASFQIDATPAEDLIAETEATSKEPQVVAPSAPEPVKTVDHVEDDDDEEDFEGVIAAPPYEQQIEYSDDEEEEKDAEYSPFLDDTDDVELFRPAAGEPAAAFCDFNEDDDHEDEA